MVGFITLFGFAVRNGILLLSHYNRLMEHDGVEWSRGASSCETEEAPRLRLGLGKIPGSYENLW